MESESRVQQSTPAVLRDPPNADRTLPSSSPLPDLQGGKTAVLDHGIMWSAAARLDGVRLAHPRDEGGIDVAGALRRNACR